MIFVRAEVMLLTRTFSQWKGVLSCAFCLQEPGGEWARREESECRSEGLGGN